jgi:serine protease Do
MLVRARRIIHSSVLTLALAAVGCSASGSAGGADQAVDPQAGVHQLVEASLPTDTTIAGLVERVSPAVVSITTTKQSAPSRMMLPNLPPGFGELFQHSLPQRLPQQRGAGSGFIVDADGYVVTNAHVVDGADEVVVKLKDEREFTARVVGKDDKLDLALLKIDHAGRLPAVKLGDSEKLRVGEHVLAVGNPFGLGSTVTLGIVSAKTRAIGAGPYEAFIQTDASINPGNSGGPLFDLSGRVVGINAAIRPGADGIGFAIPVNDLEDVLAQLRETGHVERGRLGLRFQQVTPDLAKALGLSSSHGALVAEVEKNSPASEAGIVDGDVIVAVDGHDVVQSNELARAVARHAPGSHVTIDVIRDGKRKQLKATLGKLQDDSGMPSGLQRTPHDGNSTTSKLNGLELVERDGGVFIVGFDKPHDQLRSGDRIIEVDGKSVGSIAELKKRLDDAERPAVLLKVARGSTTLFVGLDRH